MSECFRLPLRLLKLRCCINCACSNFEWIPLVCALCNVRCRLTVERKTLCNRGKDRMLRVKLAKLATSRLAHCTDESFTHLVRGPANVCHVSAD